MLRFMPPLPDKKRKNKKDDDDEGVEGGDDDTGDTNCNEVLHESYGAQVKLAMSRLSEKDMSFELIEVKTNAFCYVDRGDGGNWVRDGRRGSGQKSKMIDFWSKNHP